MENTNTIERADKFNIRDLNLYYGNFHALKGINMDIKEKEITAFIGPSGSSTVSIYTARWISTFCASGWAWCSKSPIPSP